MNIGVLALQGAFIEHINMLETLGVHCFQLRKREDLERELDGLVLPGGESTVQGRLLKDLDMFNEIKEKIEGGMPTLGTCAGLILLAERLSNDERRHLATFPITVKRNAYGRQLGSFFVEEEFKGLGKVPMKFIRAPYIENVGDGVEVLAAVDNNIVAARFKNQIGLAFHPELCDDTRIHRMFIEICSNRKENK